MGNVYDVTDGVECRACGAAFAPPDAEGPFCQTCMSKFRYEFYGRTEFKETISGAIELGYNTEIKHTEDDLNKWLVRQLELHLITKKKYGFAARCEALTGSDINGNGGYQCSYRATNEVCGRYLCERHTFPKTRQGEKGRVIMMDEYKNPYDWMEEIISDLCNTDSDFKLSVLKGAGIYRSKLKTNRKGRK